MMNVLKTNIDQVIHAAIYGDNIFFACGKNQAMVRYNLKQETYNKIVDLKGKLSFLWGMTFLFENALYCCLQPGIRVLRFSMDGKDLQVFELGKGEIRIKNCICKNDTLYIFPQNLSDGVSIFSIRSQMFYPNDFLGNEIKRLGVNGEILTSYQDNEKVWLAVKDLDKNIILQYDLEKKTVKMIAVPINGKCKSLVVKENFLYFITEENNGRIDCLNLDSNESDVIHGKGDDNYTRIFLLEDKLLLDRGIRFEIMKDKKVVGRKLLMTERLNCTNYHSFFQYSDKYFFPPWRADAFLIYSPKTNEMKEFVLNIPVSEIINEQGILQENELSLRDFINNI